METDFDFVILLFKSASYLLCTLWLWINKIFYINGDRCWLLCSSTKTADL